MTSLPFSHVDVAALIAAARDVMVNAHAPYSRFAVGAAVRLSDGTIITGCNFENASYGLSLCAETVALASANAAGRLADVTAIAVVGGAITADGAVSGEAIVSPCGRCRQILNEVEHMAAHPLAIYCAPPQGGAFIQHSVATLLPHAFGPADLGILPHNKS